MLLINYFAGNITTNKMKHKDFIDMALLKKQDLCNLEKL